MALLDLDDTKVSQAALDALGENAHEHADAIAAYFSSVMRSRARPLI